MGDEREDSANQADDQGTGEESDEQRAAALRRRTEKVQESPSAPAPGDDIIIK